MVVELSLNSILTLYLSSVYLIFNYCFCWLFFAVIFTEKQVFLCRIIGAVTILETNNYLFANLLLTATETDK